MPNRSFDAWFSTFRDSIATYGYYTDFAKARGNLAPIRRQLCLMDSLLGTGEAFERDFVSLLQEYPEVLRCVPILLAVRSKSIPVQTAHEALRFDFERPTQPLRAYAAFMRETGLAELIGGRQVRSLVDYVFGVEVGLDSNARKNRGGHLMEALVGAFLGEVGLVAQREVNASSLGREVGLDLSALSNGGRTEKRFDFVVRTARKTYAIETNFYASGGSKLNETARSYKALALEARDVSNFAFVWFTDGGGWQSARNNLRETFDVLPHLYNLHDLEQGIAHTVFQ